MPGRVSVRAARQAGPAAKSRASTRNVPGVEIPDEGPDSSLRAQVCAVFGEVQKSNTGHRKSVVALRKIQEACCYEPANPKKHQAQEDFDENEFNGEFCRCLLRILLVKKSEAVGDRILRYAGVFLKHATDLDNAIFQDEDADPMQVIPETPTSRLTSQIISLLLPLLAAKDKVVRFRATQIIAHLINTLDSVDDELFHHIRLGLLRRLRDKESTVRVQAVYGLGRMAGEMDVEQDDDEDSEDDTAGGVLEKLLDVLQNDSSTEVRRSLLLNLPFTPATLPFLLERARDLDAGIRRALYSRLLPALGDFRHLSLTHREKLLRWGLRDRDDSVKKATARLFRERWIEDCVRPRDGGGDIAEHTPGNVSEPTSEGLLELLERIDVVNAGGEGGIALDAMKEFWAGRPDYCDFVSFDEDYWKDLTPESAFVARTFNDFSQQSSTFEDKMPELTRFAFLLQTNINTLVDRVQRSAFEPDSEEDSVQQEFVVEQLLHVALTLDYSDEVGRRTMFSLMREALALAELPEECTRLVTEVLRTACGSTTMAEKEFSDVVLEAIAEVHDTILGEDQPDKMDIDDESFHSARSEVSGNTTPKNRIVDHEAAEEKAIKEIMVNMKCLHIAQCMLQNVECNLESNVALVTMLNNLVVPAVRSQEAPIRERGLLCLGLCCLLDKNLAEENLELFLLCFSKGHEELQTIAIQIIGDILSAHPTLLTIAAPQAEDGQAIEHALHKPIHKLFSKSLKSQYPLVQSTACTALAKLMLSSPPGGVGESNTSILNHDELLRMLTVAYFDPDMASNSALRQSLSYFLPVYCHSRKENMLRMGRIAMSIVHWCLSIKEEMDVDDNTGEGVGLGVVIAHIVDWTDERKLANAMMRTHAGVADEVECEVHLQLAMEVLEKVLGVCSKEERKLYMSMLGKMNLTPSQDSEQMQQVAKLVQEAIDEKIAEDAATRTTLSKIQTAIGKFRSGSGRSRGESMAPTSEEGETRLGDGGLQTSRGAEDDEEEEAEEEEERMRKRATSAPSSPRRKTKSQRTTKAVMEAQDDEITAVTEAIERTMIKEEQGDEEEQVVMPPSRGYEGSRPRWSPAELVAVAETSISKEKNDDTTTPDQHQSEQEAAAAAAATSSGSSGDNITTTSVDVADGIVEGPIAKRRGRGRPAKSIGVEQQTEAAASETPAPRPARNVRQSRRTMAARASEDAES